MMAFRPRQSSIFLWLVILCLFSEAKAAGQQNPAYFQWITLADGGTFVVRLHDENLIREAREILKGDNGDRVHIAGTIVKAPAAYNEPWSFHVDPNSVEFFENATEVCDASVSLVENNLEEAGDAFLPNGRWCPWSSRLLREIQPDETVISVVSAATFREVAISPGSLASIFGEDMTNATESASGEELPTTLGGIQVRLRRDGSDDWRTAPLLFASPEIINFVVPDQVSPGLYLVRVVRENERDLSAYSPVESPAPGIFFGEADGENYAAATLLRIRKDGSYTTESLLTVDPDSNEYVAVPIKFESPDDKLYLSLYGTGIGDQEITVRIDSDNVPVQFSGPQGSVPGLDQINIELGASFASESDLEITVSGETDDGESLQSVPVKVLVQSQSAVSN